MNIIEKEAIQKYEVNLYYFQTNHPELYHRLIAFENALQTNILHENYELRYEDNYFDLFDKRSNTFLYKTNSIEYSKKLANSINFIKGEGSIETFYNFKFSDDVASQIDNVPFRKHRLSAAASIINYVNKVAPKTTEMKRIPKFIFFGVGLGLHIPFIDQKINSPYYWIIEDDIELFRLSLFTVEYNVLAQNSSLLFSVMADDNTIKNDYFLFYGKGHLENNFLKYVMFSDNYLRHIKTIHEAVLGSLHMSFPYYKRLEKAVTSPQYIVQGHKFLNISAPYNNTIFSDKPVMLIAAGPSLDKNIQWLKENHHKFIIVCVMAALKTLKKHEIKPQLVVHIDATIESLKFLDSGAYESLQDTPILFASNVLDKVVNLFDKNQLYFFEQGTRYKKGFGKIVAPSVGETTAILMLIFGVTNLYLLGLDLAVDQETGATHSSSHSFGRKIDQNKQSQTTTSLLHSLVTVKGNFRDFVSTTPVLKLSVDTFAVVSQRYKHEYQNIYNLNDGAYLKGALPTFISDIDIETLNNIDYDESKQLIKGFLNNISSNIFTDEDKEIILHKLSEAYRVKTELESFQQKTFSTLDELSIELSKLMVNISLQKNDMENDIKDIYTHYFFYIMGYITSLFNTKNLKNSKRHSKKIHKILLKQLFKIINSYIESMNIYIQEQNKKIPETAEAAS